jgi:hypothetical protein
MNKEVMSDQNGGQMSIGVLKASDGQRNFIKREKTPALPAGSHFCRSDRLKAEFKMASDRQTHVLLIKG